MPPPLLREFLFAVAVVLSQLPASLGRFWGRRSFLHSTTAQWQKATDPQSAEEGSQRACHNTDTASGRLALAVRKLSLWDASPGVLSQLPASLGRFWGRRSFVRSTIARWQEATTDPKSPDGRKSAGLHAHGGCPLHRFWATSTGSWDAASSGCQPGVRVVPLFVWSVLGSPPPSSVTVALFTQSYPADLEVTLPQRGLTIGHHVGWSAGRLRQCEATPPGDI